MNVIYTNTQMQKYKRTSLTSFKDATFIFLEIIIISRNHDDLFPFFRVVRIGVQCMLLWCVYCVIHSCVAGSVLELFPASHVKRLLEVVNHMPMQPIEPFTPQQKEFWVFICQLCFIPQDECNRWGSSALVIRVWLVVVGVILMISNMFWQLPMFVEWKHICTLSDRTEELFWRRQARSSRDSTNMGCVNSDCD